MSSMLDRYLSADKMLRVFIAVIGAPVNLVAIAILSRGKCGLSTCTTRYLVAMAAGDLLTVVIEVFLYRIIYKYLPWTFLSITPVCRVMEVLRFIATYCSVWFTVAFTVDRFVAICCQKLKTKYCTGKTAAVILTTTSVLCCLKNITRYFLWEPREIIDNVPWFCKIMDYISSDPWWRASQETAPSPSLAVSNSAPRNPPFSKLVRLGFTHSVPPIREIRISLPPKPGFV
ncbi:probable G-protein coupled receptor 139 [Hypanus sabinus]|uniref:probable G-protein coupled receptor 139 n=1 Tax=Hypanus sabinus TaxID=79690 RepID=UPI0028C3B6A8|nr:probable G-protein coupled receptor 139 [Hypanus sabinus]